MAQSYLSQPSGTHQDGTGSVVDAPHSVQVTRRVEGISSPAPSPTLNGVKKVWLESARAPLAPQQGSWGETTGVRPDASGRCPVLLGATIVTTSLQIR
ncbi:hypothetical protein AHiyo1_49040 [Arthrobacter sp. Hiyo1]|uniref:hypothetical protein n=1 Tax=Arthrobacter gyeryongensis TaxID=1650592 RepID=UPI0006A3A473|nr:hypothetical protein AHiyo1_49040 [Arthrobacter sp. Hiyo1]